MIQTMNAVLLSIPRDVKISKHNERTEDKGSQFIKLNWLEEATESATGDSTSSPINFLGTVSAGWRHGKYGGVKLLHGAYYAV